MRNQVETINTWTPFSGGVALECQNGVKLWKMVHFHYTLCVLHRGHADWRYRRRHFSVAPGAAYVCEPGEVHDTCRVYGPGDFTVLFLDPKLVLSSACALGIGGEPHFAWNGLPEPAILQRVARFRSLLGARSLDTQEQELSLLVSALLLQASPEVRQPEASEAVVRRARLLLEQQFRADPTQPLRLPPLAKDLGVSYHALLHGFSKHYSAAPYELVSSMRAQHVLSELRRGPSSECPTLTAVAHKWGYSDSSHMTRAFRQQFATTPSALTRQMKITWKRAERAGSARASRDDQ